MIGHRQRILDVGTAVPVMPALVACLVLVCSLFLLARLGGSGDVAYVTGVAGGVLVADAIHDVRAALLRRRVAVEAAARDLGSLAVARMLSAYDATHGGRS